MKITGRIIVYILLIGSIISCKKDKDDDNDPTSTDFNREEMLSNLTDNYILPAYQVYTQSADSLKSLSLKFTTTLSESDLSDLRDQWYRTLLLWQDISFLEFGPAAEMLLHTYTNLYPVDTNQLATNISEEYDLSLPKNIDAQGLQAIDYMINGTGDNDSDIVAYYQANTERGAYLNAIVAAVASNASSVNASWAAYSVTFVNNSSSVSQGSSVSDLVNAIIQHYEVYVRKGKIGLPAGKFNLISGLTLPNHVEAYYYGQSLPFVKRAVEAHRKIIFGISYNGSTNGSGLDDYMDFVEATYQGNKLSTAISNKLSSIQSELNKLSDPLSVEVDNNKPGLTATYDQMQLLVPLLKVDMTSALGILVSYQDNDGD